MLKTKGKKLSGAAKRKKKKEKEEAIAEATADMERLKLGPTELWTGLVLHHKDIFVSHVLPKLNATDRFFFLGASGGSWDVLEHAKILSALSWNVHECTSVSTLEFAWNNMEWGTAFPCGSVKDETWFCFQVAQTNKLELLEWAREVEKCEWDEWTITKASSIGNLEMLKYCFANGCPCDEETEQELVIRAAQFGHVEILKYFVEERKALVCLKVQHLCVTNAARFDQLACLRYLVEEARVPLNHWQHIAEARYGEHLECTYYLKEKGSPEPTLEQYAEFVRYEQMQSQH